MFWFPTVNETSPRAKAKLRWFYFMSKRILWTKKNLTLYFIADSTKRKVTRNFIKKKSWLRNLKSPMNGSRIPKVSHWTWSIAFCLDLWNFCTISWSFHTHSHLFFIYITHLYHCLIYIYEVFTWKLTIIFKSQKNCDITKISLTSSITIKNPPKNKSS